MTKHFPGGGPQKDGEGPHFPYGREQVYPGRRFSEHVLPFEAAIAAGTAQIMPYYGMPIGIGFEDKCPIVAAMDGVDALPGQFVHRLEYARRIQPADAILGAEMQRA